MWICIGALKSIKIYNENRKTYFNQILFELNFVHVYFWLVLLLEFIFIFGINRFCFYVKKMCQIYLTNLILKLYYLFNV